MKINFLESDWCQSWLHVIPHHLKALTPSLFQTNQGTVKLPFLLTIYVSKLDSRTQKMMFLKPYGKSFHELTVKIEKMLTVIYRTLLSITKYFLPREDAGGLSREYVLRIPSVS